MWVASPTSPPSAGVPTESPPNASWLLPHPYNLISIIILIIYIMQHIGTYLSRFWRVMYQRHTAHCEICTGHIHCPSGLRIYLESRVEAEKITT